MKITNGKRARRVFYWALAAVMAAALVTAGCKAETSNGDEPRTEKDKQDPSKPPAPQPPSPTPNPPVPNGKYTKVKFSDLDTYLTKTAQTSKTNYIEVTGLTAGDLKGEPGQSSKLGDALKKHKDKKVGLKLGDGITGLTDMTNCFRDCENLMSLEAVPEGVTTLKYCFESCTGLTEVNFLPQSLTEMERTFEKCTSLTAMPKIPENVTVMTSCFSQCEKLSKTSALPSKVEYLDGCFVKCSDLTAGPDIPKDIKDMEACFVGCEHLDHVRLLCDYSSTRQFTAAFRMDTALANGGIKVPKGQLEAYKEHTMEMGTTADKFSEEN
ncbi:MAG: leucine-rich repeat domain-containing protein [Treponema sp.]